MQPGLGVGKVEVWQMGNGKWEMERVKARQGPIAFVSVFWHFITKVYTTLLALLMLLLLLLLLLLFIFVAS